MTTASGGLFLKVVDQDQAMNLFGREAVLRVSAREAPPPVKLLESLEQFNSLRSKTVERCDVESAVPAVVKAKTLTAKAVEKKKVQVSANGSASLRRIMKEYGDFQKDPPHCGGFFVSELDVRKWKAVLTGREGTPYAGGNFLLTFEFPNEYPFKPIKVKFVTRIYHPNINSNGSICLDILKDCVRTPCSPRLRPSIA